MQFIYNDGGRQAAGFQGKPGDCVCRAIAIITQRPYKEVYTELNEFAKEFERSKRGKIQLAYATGRGSSARDGVFKETSKAFIDSLGFRWVPTMQVGKGCTVHLRREELPSGRLIVSVSKHITAVVDGVIYDIYNPDRDGQRCVYGYWVR